MFGHKPSIISPLSTHKNILHSIDYANVNLKRANVISVFDSLDDWNMSTTGNVSKEEDTEKVTYSNKSIKFISNDAGGNLWKSVDLDLYGKVFVLKIFIDDIAKVSSLQITFFNEGLTDYYGYYPAVAQLQTGWNLLTVPMEALTPKDANSKPTTLKKVKRIYLYLKATSGNSAIVTFDFAGFVENATQRGKVVLAFDDGLDGVWNYAKPIMDKYGFRGIIYAIKNYVGDSSFMTLDQLKTLYEIGWDIGTHGSVDLTSLLTAEDISEELHLNYDYLIENGFYRSAKHYATHQGKYNDLALTEIKKIFLTHRTTNFGYDTLPHPNRYLIRNLGGNNSTLEALQMYIDRIEQRRYFAVINFHQISETPGATDADAVVFENFIDYIAAKNIDVVTLSDVFNPIE